MQKQLFTTSEIVQAPSGIPDDKEQRPPSPSVKTNRLGQNLVTVNNTVFPDTVTRTDISAVILKTFA
jgi:hypothetical protein